MRKYYQGFFTPKHPEKYIGNINKIIFRSSYEKIFMIFLDTTETVIYWNSEGVAINYFDSTTNTTRKYYPDFLIQVKTTDGIKSILIEIKPEKQTKIPNGKKMTKRLINETVMYQKNLDKWNSAKIWCSRNNVEFKILTENDLGIT